MLRATHPLGPLHRPGEAVTGELKAARQGHVVLPAGHQLSPGDPGREAWTVPTATPTSPGKPADQGKSVHQAPDPRGCKPTAAHTGYQIH